MRWGIVGTGTHSKSRIAPALCKLEGESLAGVVGSTPEKAASFARAFPGCKAFDSLESMLCQPDIDAVFISTPNDQHRSQTELAAAYGKHVLVEKPMALTADDCRAMVAACERAGVALGVGFHLRHTPVHIAMRQLVKDRAIGDIVLCRAEWHTSYGAWDNWRADPRRSGSDILAAVGVHVFDLLSFVLDSRPAKVSAFVDRSAQTGMDQTIAAIVGYDCGAVGTATVTRRARSMVNSLHLLGTKGSASGIGTIGMAPAGRLDLVIDGNAETRDFPVVDAYAAQFEDFSRKVKGGKSPDASGEDGLNSVLLTEQILAFGGFPGNGDRH